MQLPREPRTGDQIDATFGAQIVRYLRAITPRPSGSVRLRTTAGGTTFEASLPARPGSVQSDFPFRVTDASTETTAQVLVQFGQVRNITPTIATVALDDPAVGALAVVSGVIYLRVNLVDGFPDTVEVLNAATLPAETETEGFLTLATVTVADGAVTAINQSVKNSQWYLRCNGQDVFGAV